MDIGRPRRTIYIEPIEEPENPPIEEPENPPIEEPSPDPGTPETEPEPAQ